MNGATATLRKPICETSFGATLSKSWKDCLVWLSVEAGLAPRVNLARIRLAAGADAPRPSIGDTGNIALGYEDGGSGTVFTGSVAQIESCLDGGSVISVCDGSTVLAGMFIRGSYERQKGGDIVRNIAQRAGVRAGSVEDGCDLPFFAADASCDAYALIARLAEDCGFCAGVNAEGELEFKSWPSGRSSEAFAYGDDLLACMISTRTKPVGRLVVTGEGASGNQGEDAWCWLLEDSSSVTASAGRGDDFRNLVRGELRSSAAAAGAVKSIDAGREDRRTYGRLLVPGTPKVTPGSLFEIANGADHGMGGTWRALAVHHAFSKDGGFTTRIHFCSGGGSGGGGLR